MLGYLIAAHAFGDFPLQNHWMQRKNSSSFVCTVHVAVYALPFLLLVWKVGLPWWALAAILVQHWLQDRFALHIRWMGFFGQTTPDMWPMGPLCMDQAWHISFLGVIAYLST
jgi:hypothetical protein